MLAIGIQRLNDAHSAGAGIVTDSEPDVTHTSDVDHADPVQNRVPSAAVRTSSLYAP